MKSQRCHEEAFHGLLALGTAPLKLGAMSQSPRALFVTFFPPLVPKVQQESPFTCGGLLFPKAMSMCLFALAPGPPEQAGEYSPIFPGLVSARPPWSAPAAELELQSRGAALPPEQHPPPRLLSFTVWRAVCKHFIQPPSVGVSAVAHRACFKRPLYCSVILAA